MIDEVNFGTLGFWDPGVDQQDTKKEIFQNSGDLGFQGLNIVTSKG